MSTISNFCFTSKLRIFLFSSHQSTSFSETCRQEIRNVFKHFSKIKIKMSKSRLNKNCWFDELATRLKQNYFLLKTVKNNFLLAHFLTQPLKYQVASRVVDRKTVMWRNILGGQDMTKYLRLHILDPSHTSPLKYRPKSWDQILDLRFRPSLD